MIKIQIIWLWYVKIQYYNSSVLSNFDPLRYIILMANNNKI